MSLLVVSWDESQTAADVTTTFGYKSVYIPAFLLVEYLATQTGGTTVNNIFEVRFKNCLTSEQFL